MKKLIIVFSAVLALSFANAASCNWTGLGVTLQSTTDVATSYTVYLLDASITDASTMAGYLSSGNMSFLEAATVQTTSGLKAGANMRWSKSGFGDYAEGTSATYYTIIFNSNIADASYYMITAEKTATAPANGMLQMTFGSQAGNTWHAMTVPEPTSGLMILLGMAGLALRRKQA